MKADFAVIAIVGVYTLVAAVLQAIGPHHRDLVVLWTDAAVAFSVFALLVVMLVALDVLRANKSFTTAEGWRELGRRCVEPQAILRWLVACVVFWPFMDVFGWYKSRIPISHPALWDPAIVRLEAALHFGRQPWEWLQPVLGGMTATRAVDLFYHQIYPAVVIATVVAFALLDRGVRRGRFMILFLATWIVVGTIGGTLFASVGPCYFGLQFPDVPNPFGPLMAHLHAVDAATHLSAISSQEFLWAGYTHQATPLGVSAMPSVHVALAALVMVAAFDFNVWVRIAGVLFWFATLVGSVATGWHYASDGYVGTILVVLLWWASKRLVPGRKPDTKAIVEARLEALAGRPRAPSKGVASIS